MSISQPDKDRRLLPRWQSSRQSIVRGELASLRKEPRRLLEDIYFEERKREWKETRSLEVAAELVGSAIVLGRVKEVESAARLIADNNSDTTPTLREMALQALGHTRKPVTPSPSKSPGRLDRALIYAAISSLRGHLHSYPRNALERVDLARLYTILGQNQQAERAIRFALILAPEDRFVLRCAARFYVHVEKTDHALDVLRKARATKFDPWLMAPEISIALIAKRSSKMVGEARKELRRDFWSPRDRSEIEGALGTVFLEDGAIAQARQMFRRSLDDPTENAIAQAQWAVERTTGLAVPEKYLRLPTSYEARALSFRTAGKWKSVIDNCWNWAEYEPTSSRSMVMGSYAASIAFEDGPMIIQFSTRGLEAEPHNSILLNNLAVGLAYKGDLQEAWNTLNKIIIEKAPDLTRPAHYATTGLLFFRSGDFEKGRAFYQKAITHPYTRKDNRVKALALWHLVREEAHAKTEEFQKALSRAEEATAKMKFPEIEAIRARLPKRYR